MFQLANSFRFKTFGIFIIFAFYALGFSFSSHLFAQDAHKSIARKNARKKVHKLTSMSSDEMKPEMEGEKSEELFLPEENINQKYLPDIYRCPECGYEQDEPGFCPDHNEIELVRILAASRDPLEPSELDGNEDILVDIPLKNLEFHKEKVFKSTKDSLTVNSTQK